MGLFRFVKSQLLKNIDWTDSSKNTMVYRYPMDGKEIMIGSKLTVRESQVAVFVVKGKVADIFTPGIHTLVVNNLPILSKLLAWPRGFKTPFTAEVYFVNTKQFTNQKWGTTNPILMRDDEFGKIRVRGYGSFSFKVNDPRVFLEELFGTNAEFTTDSIVDYLKSMLVSGISDTIAESKISALDLACNLQEFNTMAKAQVSGQFEALGLKLVNLIVENLSFPEEVEKAIDTSSSMNALRNDMDTLIKYKTAGAIGDAANNPGMAGLGSQLGTGMALGEIVKDALKNSKVEKTSENNSVKDARYCPECGAKNSTRAKFCVECGKKLVAEKAHCPKCNAEVRPTAKFCPECGTKL